MSFYQHHIFVCTNQRAAGHKRGCCASKGSEKLREYMKRRVKELGLTSGPSGTRVNSAGCLDRCEHGPCMVVYPEAVWYHPQNEAEVDQIIEQHLQQGQIVKGLEILDDKK